MVYRIQSSRNKEITGVNDVQSETAFSPINIWDPLHINQWIGKEIPDYAVIPIPKIKIKAKLTDLMSVYFFGSSFKLTISNKLKLILEKYSRDKIQYVPIVMQQAGKQVNGYWLTNILDFDNDKIDFSGSEIVSRNYPLDSGYLVKIKDYGEYLDQKKKIEFPYNLYFQKIAIRSDVTEKMFMLEKVYGGIGYYVSESLKKILDAEGCTGIEYSSIEQG
ncbi:hypothetical protein [Sediminibacterium sp.]|uniref:hypothetical protein n=1 Tax=Sediminibacterium sp. TaxID=1917865 RepID=UPI002721062D|nr:hypothetical protein [Sediminibacterium sp.]MDO8995513.1 hypothetical protein [Sediminibacterium sp.]MDO9156477.1 hypothetical protein [Sediminibacterium sp.]MDP1972876.1 hypothetical protein [Sediminibacterium sp.]MDP2421497.1 hypothetical protein [Sediminibacterium sp.]